MRVVVRLTGTHHLPLLALGCVSGELWLLVAEWFNAQVKAETALVIYTEDALSLFSMNYMGYTGFST